MREIKNTEISIEIEEFCKLIELENPKIIMKPDDIRYFKLVRETGSGKVKRIIIQLN